MSDTRYSNMPKEFYSVSSKRSHQGIKQNRHKVTKWRRARTKTSKALREAHPAAQIEYQPTPNPHDKVPITSSREVAQQVGRYCSALIRIRKAQIMNDGVMRAAQITTPNLYEGTANFTRMRIESIRQMYVRKALLEADEKPLGVELLR